MGALVKYSLFFLLFCFLITTQIFSQPSGSPLQGLGKKDITVKFGVPGSNGARVKPHNGIDFAVKEGTKVLATADGVINRVKNSTGHYGLNIKIRHDDVYETFFAHLQKAFVAVGDSVRQGDVIGYVGTSGLTDGPTLHYEIRKNGEQIDPEKNVPD